MTKKTSVEMSTLPSSEFTKSHTDCAIVSGKITRSKILKGICDLLDVFLTLEGKDAELKANVLKHLAETLATLTRSHAEDVVFAKVKPQLIAPESNIKDAPPGHD